MNPRIFDSAGRIVAVLNNLIDIEIQKKLYDEDILIFECVETELLTEYIQVGNKVETDGQIYEIKRVEIRHDNVLTYYAECEHCSYELNNYIVENFNIQGKARQILAKIIENTPFTIGDVDDSESFIFVIIEKTSRRGLVNMLAKFLDFRIVYDNYSISLYAVKDDGYDVCVGKNITGISKITDVREEKKVSYTIDIVELSHTVEYESLGYESLESITLGNRVRVIDAALSLDEMLQVVAVRYNPVLHRNSYIELADSIEDINDALIVVKEQFKRFEIRMDEELTFIKGDVVETQKKYSELVFTINEFRTEIGKEITTVKGDVTETNRKLSSFEQDVNGFKLEVSQEFTTVEGDIFTSKQNIASLTVNLNSITQRVETAEGNIGNLTVNSNAITQRIETAEGNISAVTVKANSIESRVNSTFVTITEGAGITVQNGGLRVMAGTNKRLEISSSGALAMQGDLYNYSGSSAIRISGGRVYFSSGNSNPNWGSWSAEVGYIEGAYTYDGNIGNQSVRQIRVMGGTSVKIAGSSASYSCADQHYFSKNMKISGSLNVTGSFTVGGNTYHAKRLGSIGNSDWVLVCPV